MKKMFLLAAIMTALLAIPAIATEHSATPTGALSECTEFPCILGEYGKNNPYYESIREQYGTYRACRKTAAHAQEQFFDAQLGQINNAKEFGAQFQHKSFLYAQIRIAQKRTRDYGNNLRIECGNAFYG